MKKIRLAVISIFLIISVISVILLINSNSIKEETWTNNEKIKEKIPEWESYSKDNYSYQYPAGLVPAEISTPPWNNEIFFFLSEKDADKEVKCFLNQEGAIDEPCGQNLAMKVKYGLVWISKDEVMKNKRDFFSTTTSLNEYMDIKGRTWYIVGPIWTNVESHVDAVTFKGGVAHRVYVTLSVNGIEDYLDEENLVIESTNVQGFPNYNALPLAKLHKQITMEMLSTFKLRPTTF